MDVGAVRRYLQKTVFYMKNIANKFEPAPRPKFTEAILELELLKLLLCCT